jgi:2-oxoglutarate dehydrogenase complex dehydrogenase (E1) component-like enzyme
MIARSSAQEASVPVQVGFAPNAEMLEAMYERWKADPASVDRDWQCFFAGFDLGYLRPMPGDGDHSAPASAPLNEAVLRAGRGDQQKVDSLIAAYRALGHTICHLDPLDLNNTPTNPYLELAAFGLSDDDLDREYASDSIAGFPDRTRLRDIISYLRLIANDGDDPAFIRAVTTPKRGVGMATLEVLGARRSVNMKAR